MASKLRKVGSIQELPPESGESTGAHEFSQDKGRLVYAGSRPGALRRRCSERLARWIQGLLKGIPLRQSAPFHDIAQSTAKASDANDLVQKINLLEQELTDTSSRLRHTIAQQSMLNSISQRIVAQTDLSTILPEIVKSAVTLLDGWGGCIALKEKDRPGCRIVAFLNLPRELEGLYLPPGKAISSYVLEHARPVIVDDYSTYIRRNPLLSGLRLKSTICVPLSVEDEVLGTLVVSSNDPNRRFSEEDLGLLTSFANQAAIAIKNAQLHSQNLEQLTRLSEAKRRLGQQSRRLRELLVRTFHAQEEERRRIARDVHDGITQFIVAATMEAYAAKTALSRDPVVATERLESVEQLLTQALCDLRQVIRDLRPRLLDERGLIPALDHLTTHFREVSGISCTLCVSGNRISLNPAKEIAIYRIVQESLNNVLKHARATRVAVGLSFRLHVLVIQVEDDGQGFRSYSVGNSPADGLGLTSMRERAESIGAELAIESCPSSGTKVLLTVPIDRRSKTRPAGKEDDGHRQDQSLDC